MYPVQHLCNPQVEVSNIMMLMKLVQVGGSKFLYLETHEKDKTSHGLFQNVMSAYRLTVMQNAVHVSLCLYIV